MGAVKGFLELWFDFLLFIAGCLLMINGFAILTSTQDALNASLVDKGNSIMIEERPLSYISGEEVIALLLQPDGVERVQVNSFMFSGSTLKNAINEIDVNKDYEISRKFGAEGIRLKITTYVP